MDAGQMDLQGVCEGGTVYAGFFHKWQHRHQRIWAERKRAGSLSKESIKIGVHLLTNDAV